MNRHEIQSFIREHGVEGFRAGFSNLIDGYKLPNGQIYKVDINRISLRELWEGCVGPINNTFDNAYWRETGGGAALDPSGFPSATEKLLSTVTIEAYQARQAIADSLVTMSTTPTTLTERIVGFTVPEGPKNIMPGEDYPRTGIGEKYVTFEEPLHNKKEGIEVAVTEEVVRFDQTRQIMDRASGIGMSLATERERRTVRAVLGIGLDTGSTVGGVYYPSNVDTPLYLAANSTLRTNASPIYNHPGKTADSKLEDYTDLQEVMTVHAQNIKDDRLVGTQRPIAWSPDTMLLPVALATTANNILQTSGIMYRANDGSTTTPQITHNAPNPLTTVFQGAFPVPYTSAYVDEVSATQWVVYDKRATFLRVNIFPFATFRAPAGYGWNADIVFAMRIREWSRVIARENKMAIKSTGA